MRQRYIYTYYHLGGAWWRSRTSGNYANVNEVIPDRRVPKAIRQLHGDSPHLWRYDLVNGVVRRHDWEGWMLSYFNAKTLQLVAA